MMKMNLSKVKLILGLGVLLSGLFLYQDNKAYATTVVTPVTVQTVDYEEEELVLNNNGNTKFYFATEVEAAKGNWEIMPADAGTTSRMDFSWASQSVENIIKIKGGEDSTGTQVRIVLPERTTKLDITINYSSINSLPKKSSIAPLLNIMTTAGTGYQPITFSDLEWKKGDGGKWKSIDLLTVAQLEKYQIKGTDLYFRIKAVNDEVRLDVDGSPIYPDGSNGRRASSETKVKINKKATAMVVGIDGEEFTADIKYGKEYRVTIGSVRTDWIKVTDRIVKRITLSKIVKNLGDNSDGITDPFPAMFIEIRDYATTKAAASKITEINLGAQRVINSSTLIMGEAPDGATSDNKNIYISYSGNKNLIITIPSASLSNPYEYSVVKPGDTFDIERNTWSAITKGTEVKVLGSKAVDGGILYIRQKEIKSKEATRTSSAVSYELASTVVFCNIKYPSMPVVEKGSHTYIKTLPMDTNNIEFTVKLNSNGRDTYERKIKTIKLSTRSIDFDQEITPAITEANPYDKNVDYTLTVKLDKTSLESMPSSINRALTITFENGTVDKTSVKLTIKNPTVALALTATPSQGSVIGTAKVNVVSSLGEGNAYCYRITPDSLEGKVYTDDFITNKYTDIQPFTPLTDITVPAGNHLTVIEYNKTTGHFIKYKSMQITKELLGTP